MPTFGICINPDHAAAVRAAGWDYVEGHAQQLFQGTVPDEQWTGEAAIRSAELPTPAANCLVPGDLKIVGPSADLGALERYITTVIRRAARCGTTTLVFGSGAARNVPEDFDRDRAEAQILDFLRMAAPIAGAHGVTMVCEPLNTGECNIINSVAEAMVYVRQVDHPGFKCLVDSYHFWLEDEPLKHLRDAMPWIAHVHVADRNDRVAPGQSGASDYRPFFGVLKAGGYDGRISVEAGKFIDAPASYAAVLAFLKAEWDQASKDGAW